MAIILNDIEIKNFKSIKHIKTDCKRVNVFIGKPNVGKSNILEALSLLAPHYSQNMDKFLSEFIRYEEISNLFYDEEVQHTIEIKTNKVRAYLRYHSNNINQADLIVGQGKWMDTILEHTGSIASIYNYFQENKVQENLLDVIGLPLLVSPFYINILPNGNIQPERLEVFASKNFNPIKKYHFNNRIPISNKFPYFLLPPYGENLFTIIDHDKDLRKEIAEIFAEYGLRFVAHKRESKFEIEKSTDEYYVTKYHYSSIADTFQRLIFYYAAIDSNKNSVLILEEPEVHSFPPYTKDLSERIIASEDNQFFITTHSPYLLQNLISSLDSSELNVFITYFENYETKIKRLTSEDLRKASEFSVDLFYNLENFIPNA